MKQGKSKKASKDQLQVQEASSIIIATKVEIFPVEGGNQFQTQSIVSQQLVLSYLKDLSLDQIIKEGQILEYSLCGKRNNVRVLNVKPVQEQSGGWMIKKSTLFELATQENQIQTIEKLTQSKKPQLYGFDFVIDKSERIIKNALFKQNNSMTQYGFETIKGALLVGQAGIGKTALMKHLKASFEDQCKVIYKSLLMDNEDNSSISSIIAQAIQTQPCLILMDDLQLSNEKRTNQLKELKNAFEMLVEHPSIFVTNNTILASVQSNKNLDETLRRTGRFEKEISLETPNHGLRCQILKDIVETLNIPNQLSGEDLKDLCYQMSGFTINDIKSVIRDAIEVNQESIQKGTLQAILKQINPSGLKDILMDIPQVKWTDIGGYESVKLEVRKVIEWPLKHEDAFRRLGVQPSKGILLYGPPGCCKTLLARAICTQCNLAFMAVKGPELFSKYVGDSEKAVRDIFRKARLCAPSVVFFDEIDAIAPQRTNSTDVADRVLIQLLTEMDGFDALKNVIIVGATNRPEAIDKALLRPGRFDHLILVDLPDEQNRKEIFQVNFNKMEIDQEVKDSIDKLSQLTQGYTGAEICQVCKEAGLNAISRNLDAPNIQREDFEKALLKIKPRITLQMISLFRNFQDNIKSFV